MTAKQHVGALMRDVGPQLDLLEVTEFDDQDVWTLVVDETTVVFADYNDAQSRFVLSADVAQPQWNDRQALYELLLRYNNCWPQNGGVRMALDEADGNVVQLVDLPVADLDLPRLQAAILGFVATLSAWREILSRPGASGAEPPFNPLLGGMIRG
jgi:hypothetical protein